MSNLALLLTMVYGYRKNYWVGCPVHKDHHSVRAFIHRVAPEALLALYDPDSKPTNQSKDEHLSKLSQSESFPGIFLIEHKG